MSKLRGKGYDGASNMSGCFKGVKARIQEIQPLAVFTHCVGHVLNLVVEDSCENPFVRDTINTVKEAINFFKVSVQRESILKVDRKIKFIELLEPVITSLEQIKNTRPCNPATTTKATTFYKAVIDCEFILSLQVASDVLKQLSNLSKHLQKANIDYNEAFSYIQTVINRFQESRNSFDEYFSKLYEQAVDICTTFNIEIKKPRVVGRQTCRNNVKADSPEEYYRRAMAIPLLDHVISNLKERFDDRNQIISKINNLLSLNIIGLDKQELKT
jgi:hypothetical protein